MQQLFSTRDAHPRERFDYWQEVARKNIVYHDVEPDHRLHFEAQMEAGVLVDVGFVRLAHTPITILAYGGPYRAREN